jgi:hypothetical protein
MLMAIFQITIIINGPKGMLINFPPKDKEITKPTSTIQRRDVANQSAI